MAGWHEGFRLTPLQKTAPERFHAIASGPELFCVTLSITLFKENATFQIRTMSYQKTSHAPRETKPPMMPPNKIALGIDLDSSAALLFGIAHQMRPAIAPQTLPAPNTIILKVHTNFFISASLQPVNATTNKQTSRNAAFFLFNI